MEPKSIEQVLCRTGVLHYKSVGESMLPLIKEGRDTFVITQCSNQAIHKYDIVLFKRPNITERGRYVLHRVLRINKNGTYWIVGDNSVTGEPVDGKDVIGILKVLIRKGHVVSFSSFSYKMYVFVWCYCFPLRFPVLYTIKAMKRIYRMLKKHRKYST